MVLNCPKTVNVAAPPMVSAAAGSMIKAKASAPSFVNVYTHSGRVPLQAGKLNVMSAVKVPMPTMLSFSSMETDVVTVLFALRSTPSAYTAACVEVDVDTVPAELVDKPWCVTAPVNVFAPAKVCVVVDTIPPSEAVAFGMFRFSVDVALLNPKAASLNVTAGV